MSVGLMAALLGQTDLHALGVRLRHVQPLWMMAAVAVYGASIWIGAWRWQLLLETQSVSISNSKLSESLFVATFFNNFLPSNIGGDVVRVADTVPHLGSKTAATTIILVDRGLGLVALCLVASGGSLLASHLGIAVPGAGYIWLLLVGALCGAVLVLAAPHALSRLLAPLRVLRPDWIDERLTRLHDALLRLRECPVEVGSAFAGALVVQLAMVLFYLCVAHGLATPLPFVVGAVIVPVSLVAQMLPMSVNGFGIREAVFTYFFVRLGLGMDSALALSLVGAGLIMLFSVTGGALFFLRQRGGNPSAPAVRYDP